MLFGRWLIIRGVIVYLAFNLGLNLLLNLTQPLKPLRLMTVTRVDERLDAAAYLFRHYLPMHSCDHTMEPGTSRALAREVAREVGIEPALLVSLVEVESTLRPHAISPVGAMGFGQLMPSTAAWLKVSDPFHPRENLEGAARYIKSLTGRFGDVKLALAAYNAGPGAVSRYGGIPPYGETQRYVRRVTERMAYHRAQASAK